MKSASASPIPSTPLTPDAQSDASFLASLIAAYVGMKYESPEAMLVVGLVLYGMMIAFARLSARG
jgi:hypothetical protein